MQPDKLKEAIAKVLPDVEMVIGYRQGFDKIHATPYFIRTDEQIDQAIINPLCVQNLAGYLPSLKKKKVGIVVKGCDSRAVNQLLQEKLILRENIVVIGVPCKGIISVSKVLQAVNHQPVIDAAFQGNDQIIIKTADGEKTFPVSDVAPDKCKSCQYPTPLTYDMMAGEPIESDKAPESVYEDVAEIEKMTLEERLAYWKNELQRCIRCYACRNACPMCVCQESCIAESRDPHWMSQKTTIDEKFMFHMIHATHLAGRCVECGECERACPMDIPIVKFKKKINKELKELFNYEPGVKPDDKPPMYVFSVDEPTIKEHKLS